MKPAIALCLLGVVAVMLESVLADAFPVRLLPDLPLLVTVGMALTLSPGPGLAAAAVLGLATDMDSGALLGTHAFVGLLEFALARMVAAKLDLRRGIPFAVFAFGLQALDSALMLAISRLFAPGFVLAASDVVSSLVRCFPTAIVAPAVSVLARRVVALQKEAEARREMRIETHRPVL